MFCFNIHKYICLQTSHTPRDYLNSNINLIRADLNLPEDPEVCVSLTNNSDDDKTPSDSDSIGSCLALSSQVRISVLLNLLQYQKQIICFVCADKGVRNNCTLGYENVKLHGHY